MNPTLLHVLSLVLLLTGTAGFVAHLYAQWRFARTLRTRYPDKWRIIEQADSGPVNRLRIWARLQRVLRTNVVELFDDAQLLYWHRMWRYAPRLAWTCWFLWLVLQYAAATH